MCRIAFSIGPVDFYWYGIIIALATAALYGAAVWQARLRGGSAELAAEIVLLGIPAGVAGARLVYVLANWDFYRDNLWGILYIWQGGLSAYGALVGLVAVLYWYGRRRGFSFWLWADIFAPGIALGQAIGQWANFINQEGFGLPTDLRWGIYIDYACRPPGFEQFDFFHPVFLYESLWNSLLFLFLSVYCLLQRRWTRLGPGSAFLIYIILYSAGHFYLEGLRLDSQLLGGIRLGQLAAIAAAFIAGFFLPGRFRAVSGRDRRRG